jgi:hypothetical protein
MDSDKKFSFIDGKLISVGKSRRSNNKPVINFKLDNEIIDKFGNVISDIYGEPSRDNNGYIILGLDRVIRDYRGRAVKDILDQPLIFKPNKTEKSKRIIDEEIVFNDSGEIVGDRYGAVKRNSKREVIIGPEGIIRDKDGFVMYSASDVVLKKGYRFNYISKEDIDPFTLILPPIKREINVSDVKSEDKIILDKLLNIKVPEGYFEQSNLKMNDLLDENITANPDIIKNLLRVAPDFFIQDNLTTRVIVTIISFIVSNIIPWKDAKRFLSSKFLDIISNSKNNANIKFANFILKLEKTSPKIHKKISTFTFPDLLKILLGSYTLLVTGKKLAPQALSSSINAFINKTNVKLILDSNRSVDVTRIYLENNKLINKGSNTIDLSKLGLLNENSVGDNALKGIKIEFSQDDKDFPLYISNFTITNIYSSNLKKNTIFRINPYKNNQNKLDLISEYKIRTEDILKRAKDVIFGYANAVSYMNLIEDVTLDNQILKNIRLSDNKEIKKYISDKNKSISEKLNILKAANINVTPDEINLINKIRLSRNFSDLLRSSHNSLNDIIFTSEKIISDLSKITLKNYNIEFFILDDTLGSLTIILDKIDYYDPEDPLKFYKK